MLVVLLLLVQLLLLFGHADAHSALMERDCCC
jgi:hypothetical protein